MNFVDHRMTLDINSPASNAAVSVKKGDTARRLLIHLVQDGYPYHIDEDCFAVFTALKPDGTKIRNACTVEECEIAYKLTPQTVAVEGEVECEIRLYSAEETLLTSSRFFLLVNPTVYNEGDEIESTDEFDALTKLVAQTLILKDVMEEAADRAQEQAAQAADSADQALTCAVRAENAASTAENASRSAEGSAANAMGSEESARQFASEAQSSAAQAQSNAGRAEELARKAEAAAGTAENAARIAEGSEVNARGSEEASRAYAAQAQESAAEAREYAAQAEHPDAMPNPYPLILTGAVNAEYDGSEAVRVEIPEGGGGGGLSRVLLWENADTISEFSAQTIQLNDLPYFDAIEVIYAAGGYPGGYGRCYMSSGVLPKITGAMDTDYYTDGYALNSVADAYSPDVWRYYRPLSWEANRIAFMDCTAVGTYGDSETDNYYNIPARIYGIVNGAQGNVDGGDSAWELIYELEVAEELAQIDDKTIDSGKSEYLLAIFVPAVETQINVANNNLFGQRGIGANNVFAATTGTRLHTTYMKKISATEALFICDSAEKSTGFDDLWKRTRTNFVVYGGFNTSFGLYIQNKVPAGTQIKLYAK